MTLRKPSSIVSILPALSPQVPMQPAAKQVWDQKYRLKNKDGTPLDETIDDTYKRVAKALSGSEHKDQRDFWYERFLIALRKGAIPAGRIIANAGSGLLKPAASMINCTVSDTIPDSMDGILKKLREAGLTLKAGCGVGYDFSTLRPKGSYVAGAGAHTSGPLSFMDIYDRMCVTVSSAGGRRGAQMGILDVSHPDILDFIRAKREDGRLRQFNLSLLITTDFMKTVERGSDWPLVFPVKQSELDEGDLERMTACDEVVWRKWSNDDQDYIKNAQGQVVCRVHSRVPAKQIWDAIMQSTYDFAEPGFILIDAVNDQNNNWFCETIRATNPCGEQPLPPYGACLLGSINLTQYVLKPFTDAAEFDWHSYREMVKTFTRMLDNVIGIDGLPLPEQSHELKTKRRHGMGYLGLGSALAMMRIPYGSDDSLKFTEEVTRVMALAGWEVGVQLAKEKGAAPILLQDFEVTESMLASRPEMCADGYKLGDLVPGRVLLARYSHYMQRIAKVDEALVKDIETYGSRFTHHTSIAPTGTISLSLANNASNGIEPSFSHCYLRNMIIRGRKTKEQIKVYSYEMLAYRELVDNSDKATDEGEQSLPDYFVTSDQTTPQQHVAIQAAAQQWVDSSISKTANIPTYFPYADFKEIYYEAYKRGLKGCTTFRFNPQVFQGVLVNKTDLDSTVYCFELADGSVVKARGNEEIEYEDEFHTAANLFDALKEGYYGKL